MIDFNSLKAALDAHANEPFRVRQRVCAFRLGLEQATWTNKELRELCKDFGCFNSPNFTRNLKQETEFFAPIGKNTWSLTAKGRADAEALFGTSLVSADAATDDDCACDGDPDEDEAAFDPTCEVHAVEAPVEIVPPVYADELDSILAAPVVAKAAPVAVPEPVAAVKVAPEPVEAPARAPARAPRVRAADALANLFNKIETEKKEK